MCNPHEDDECEAVYTPQHVDRRGRAIRVGGYPGDADTSCGGQCGDDDVCYQSCAEARDRLKESQG